MALHPLHYNNVEDLIKTAEHHHDQYIQALRSIHEINSLKKRERPDSRATFHDATATPPLRSFTFTSDTNTILLPRARRDTLEAPERPSLCPSPKPLPLAPNPNAGSGGFAIPDEELSFIPLLDQPANSSRRVPADAASISSRVRRAITPMSFSDDMLLRHLRESEFSVQIAGFMDGEFLRRRWELDTTQSFREFAAFEKEQFVSTTFEVYEVAEDATTVKVNMDVEVQGFVKYVGDGPLESSDGIVDAPTVWEAIKDVNSSGRAVGRITIVQEPSPLMLAALHLTMSPHFDMTELLHHLLSDTINRGRTHAFMHRAFERSSTPSVYPLSPILPNKQMTDLADLKPAAPLSFSHLRQRSFFFVFKYYTLVGEGLGAAPWQRYEQRASDKRHGDHIDIAECGSILALSLGGEPTKTVRMRPRRERAREGFLFDTFGPWHLLSIQSFPDDEHTVRGDDFQQKSFYNGPYAFLELLIAEYRDAGKRNQILHDRITKLITPPTEFMFDYRLRDKLLFEDKHFTYIRRYFWAYNTLAVINTGIKAMVSAYVDTFTEDFWAGTHPLLWPHKSTSGAETDESPEMADYRAKIALLRRELDKVVSELGEVLKKNERTRKEIENLRDQLFNGSSIKESRRAVDQGDNVRILTMISMIFLPLTFVTSVFGITEFTIPATDWRFAVTMTLVCVPFMILVYLLQTRTFTQLLQKLHRKMVNLIAWPFLFIRRRYWGPDAAVAETRPVVVPPVKGRKRRLMVGRGGAAVSTAAVGGGGTSVGKAQAWQWWKWGLVMRAATVGGTEEA